VFITDERLGLEQFHRASTRQPLTSGEPTVIKRTSELRKEQGFTLIELMIVMVVLGILAGIVLFAVGNFQDDANTSRDDANTRICATAKAASLAKTGSTAGYMSYIDGSDNPCT